MSSFASCIDISCFIFLQSSLKDAQQLYKSQDEELHHYSTMYMYVEEVNFQIIKYTNHEII